MDVLYSMKEYICMGASDMATLKKKTGGSKPSSKLTLNTKGQHSCDCREDSRNCERLKKHVTDKYFEKKVRF